MMKRLTWFVGGVAAGASGVGFVKRRLQRTAAQFAPVNVARQAVGGVRDRVDGVVSAVRDGRRAAAVKEAELRARRDGRLTTLSDHLTPADRVLVDGEPVEPDRVVVWREDR